MPVRFDSAIRPEPKPLYVLVVRDARGETETFHATGDHPWLVHSRGWVDTIDLHRGDRIDTASADDLTVVGLTVTPRVERTYNLTVEGWHTFLIGEDRAVVHNACPTPPTASPIWQNLARWRGEIRRSNGRYFTYDRLHGEIEVFNSRGDHLGVMDSITGQMIKPPVPGRRINVR